MNYFTVDGEAFADYEIKRSLFTASLKGISDYDEGLSFVKGIAKKYSDATHNCYAVICLGGEQKFSDDGEPSGTAGTPILQVLKKNNLSTVACVVTRYFGGIKLGAGGLVAAYTKAATNAVSNAKICEMKESNVYLLTVPYGDYEQTVRLTVGAGGKIKETGYGSTVSVVSAVPVERNEAFLEKINEAFGGRITPVPVSTGYESY